MAPIMLLATQAMSRPAIARTASHTIHSPSNPVAACHQRAAKSLCPNN